VCIRATLCGPEADDTQTSSSHYRRVLGNTRPRQEKTLTPSCSGIGVIETVPSTETSRHTLWLGPTSSVSWHVRETHYGGLLVGRGNGKMDSEVGTRLGPMLANTTQTGSMANSSLRGGMRHFWQRRQWEG